MRKCIEILLLILFAKISVAQNASLKGKIIDKADNKPIAGATISLLKLKDSSILQKTVSGQKGKFTFDNLIQDSVIIEISTLNYQVFLQRVLVKNELNELPIISLLPQDKNLETVTIISKAPPVVIKDDTTQYSASQYKVNPDATIEDLIKKMPGVTVARDGTITAQGETVKKVTIDGKDFFGDDATAALKNLPADVVDKIQVFDRLSDQARLTGFDDGNSTKAINIVTKAGIKNGQLGRLFAGYGTDDRYNIGGNSSFFKNNRRLSLVAGFNNINQQNFSSQDLLGVSSNNNGKSNNGGNGGQGGNSRPGGGNDFTIGQVNGISKTNAFGINYSNEFDKKLIIAASYFYNNSINENKSTSNTETFFKADTNIFLKQNSFSITNNTNHKINARIEYNIDSSNSITFIPNINFQKTDANSSSDFNSYYGAASVGTLFDTLNINKTKNRIGYNIKNSILYKHLFAKKGRTFSAGINHTITKNDGESITDGNLKYYSNSLLTKDSIQNQLFDNSTNGYVIGGTLAYTEPLSKKAQLQFDYNPTIQKNKANQQTFLNDAGKFSKLDTSLTNKFDNTIVTNNAGITYRFTPAKEELFQIGISVQSSNLGSERVYPQNGKVNQTFSNILPNLIYRKKFSKKSNIRIFYRASVNFPSVNQLQDVVNLSSAIRASTGNADLKQSYTHFVGSRFTKTNVKTSKSFFAGIFLQTTRNFISNASYIPKTDSIIQNGKTLKKGSLLSKPQNLDGYRNARVQATYSMPIKFIKSNLNVNGTYSFTRLPGLVNNNKITTDNFLYSGGFSLNSNISEYVDYSLSYMANFNQANSTSTGKKNFVNQALGLQFNLLNKKGWFIQNDIVYQTNSGLTSGLNQKFGLWNAGIGRKFLTKNAGELKLSVFDLLKQNQSITRTVDENRIQDNQSLVLQQYFMLTFTYSLKNFGNAPVKPAKESKKEKKKKKAAATNF
jgi:Outer membrane protein beta-barrel family/CarboxypepD_reg-like domain